MQPYVTCSSVALSDGRPIASPGFNSASKGSTNCAGALVARKGIRPPAPSAPARGGGKRDMDALCLLCSSTSSIAPFVPGHAEPRRSIAVVVAVLRNAG